MVTKSELTRVADNIRILSAAMVEKAKSGHPGGAMGGADFMAVLYTEFLRYDPDQMDYPFRDRFFLDPGHMSPMLYSALALQGKFTIEDIKQFRQWGSITPGHPERDIERPWQRSFLRLASAIRPCSTRYMPTSAMVECRRRSARAWAALPARWA